MRHLLLFVLLLLTSLIPLAEQSTAQNLQRMNIEQKEGGTGIPVFTQHPDKAGIVIESSVPGLRFSSNMQGVVEVQEPAAGRYVLIIEPFTQIIRVDAENFVQERFRVGNPQARDVLYFSVEAESRQSDLVSVIFNVDPDDALLFLNGQQVEINSTVQLPAQGYELRLEQEGYRSINEVVNVSTENILFSYTMDEIDIVPVRIRSNVEGARVIIDGSERGQIDSGLGLDLFMFPGNYALTVSASGYTNRNLSLEVTEEGSNEFQVDLGRNIGELILQTEPDDARILVNRQEYSGQRRIELTPGRYRLEIEKRNYESYSETIEISQNEALSRNIELKPYFGTLQFSVTPSNASVELVDAAGEVVDAWNGIKLLPNLKAGRYSLVAKADGYSSKEQQIRITKDETLEIRFELEEGSEWNRDTTTKVVDVNNPVTGQTWMDRNLGASRAATSPIDEQAYGDLYQWGRSADGHQMRKPTKRKRILIFFTTNTTGETPTTRIKSTTDLPDHQSFILATDAPWDWRSPQNDDLWQGVHGVNNPCPEGYRLPTEAEWETERQSWSSDNAAGAFASPLKLSLAGARSRNNGSLIYDNARGYYWSASVSGSNASYLAFTGALANLSSRNRAGGLSVRCIKD